MLNPDQLFSFSPEKSGLVDRLERLRKEWQRQRSREQPDHSIELELAETLLESKDRRGIAEALEHFQDLAKDGYGAPQRLCLRLAQSSFMLGAFRDARHYVERCFQLPRDDEEGIVEKDTLLLKRELENQVLDDGVIGFRLIILTSVVSSIALFAKYLKSQNC